jgi:hypothetical protein
VLVDTIAEQLLFTTLRIETRSALGHGTGTGFVFNYAHGGQQYPFVVTNKHVVKNALDGSVYFHKGTGDKPSLGSAHRIEIDNFENAWQGHDDPDIDVAVMPLAPLLESMSQSGIAPFYRSIDRSLTASPELIEQLDALEEVVFIGYPNGIWDTTNFLPIFRKGTTATPIGVDFQGKKQFLVDASVFPGSSGSPVFLYNKGMYSDRKGNTTIGTRLSFLGVIASVFFREDINQIALIPEQAASTPVAIAREMIDLGIVFKAHTVLEAVEQLLKERGVSLEQLDTTA